jgi:hypothetical protein
MRILRNPTYLVKICYDGKIFPGQHEAIIDEALFKAVQKKLSQPKVAERPKAQTYPFLSTGILNVTAAGECPPKQPKVGNMLITYVQILLIAKIEYQPKG